MKILVGVILTLSAFTSGVVAAPPCNTTALSQLLMKSEVRTCRSDSGYNPTSMSKPTDAQVSAVCNSSACTQAIKAVKRVAPNECIIGLVRLYADVLNPLAQRCGNVSGSASDVGSAGVVGCANASDPGSGPMVGSTNSSKTKSPTTNKTRTASPRNDSPSTTATQNGAPDAPTLSSLTAIAVLATVVATIV